LLDGINTDLYVQDISLEITFARELLRNWHRFQPLSEEDSAENSEPSCPSSPPFRLTEEYQAIEDAGLAQRRRLWNHLVGYSSSEVSDSSSEISDSDPHVSNDSGLPEFFEDLGLKLDGSQARTNSPIEVSGSIDSGSDTSSESDSSRASKSTPPRHLIARMNKAEKELLEDVANMRFSRKEILNKPAVVQKYFSRAILKALQPYPALLGHFANLISFEMYSIPSRVDAAVMMARMRYIAPPPERVEQLDEPKQDSTASDDEATSDNALQPAYSIQVPPQSSRLHSAEPEQSTQDPNVTDANAVSDEGLPPADNIQDSSQFSRAHSVDPVAGPSTSQPETEILVRPCSADSIAQSDISQLQPDISPRSLLVGPVAQSDTLQRYPDIFPRPYSIVPAELLTPGNVQRRLSADLAPNPSPALSNDAGETPGNLTQLTEQLEFVQRRADEEGVVPQSRFATPALSQRATPINAENDEAPGVAGPSSSSHPSYQKLSPHTDQRSIDSPPRRPSLPLLQPRPINPNPEHNHSLIRGQSYPLPIHSGPRRSLPTPSLPRRPRIVHPGHDNHALVEPPTLDQPYVDIQPAFGAYVRRRSSRIQEVYEENDVVGESRTRRTSESEFKDLQASKKFRARFDSMWQWPGNGNGNGNGGGNGSGNAGAISG
jgi:hypothetical protein